MYMQVDSKIAQGKLTSLCWSKGKGLVLRHKLKNASFSILLQPSDSIVSTWAKIKCWRHIKKENGTLEQG